MFRRRDHPEGESTLLPQASLDALAEFGESHFAGVEPDWAVDVFYVPGYEAGRREPDRMIREVCQAGSRSGGWALVGASRVLHELAVPDRESHPVHLALLDDELSFFQSLGASERSLRPWERDRWIQSHGLSVFTERLPGWAP